MTEEAPPARVPGPQACTPENVALLLQELTKLEQERDAAIARHAELANDVMRLAARIGARAFEQPGEVLAWLQERAEHIQSVDKLLVQKGQLTEDSKLYREGAEHFRLLAARRDEVIQAIRALAKLSDPNLIRFSGKDLLDILSALDGRTA